MLLEHGARINVRDKSFGMNPLHYAISRRKIQILLLEHGADVNMCNESGEAPGVELGSWYGCQEIVELPTEYGAGSVR